MKYLFLLTFIFINLNFISCRLVDTVTGNYDSCYDGILNQDETAIDCGGSCPVCPTCYDGLQNGNESGIDCGLYSCGFYCFTEPDCNPEHNKLSTVSTSVVFNEGTINENPSYGNEHLKAYGNITGVSVSPTLFTASVYFNEDIGIINSSRDLILSNESTYPFYNHEVIVKLRFAYNNYTAINGSASFEVHEDGKITMYLCDIDFSSNAPEQYLNDSNISGSITFEP